MTRFQSARPGRSGTVLALLAGLLLTGACTGPAPAEPSPAAGDQAIDESAYRAALQGAIAKVEGQYLDQDGEYPPDLADDLWELFSRFCVPEPEQGDQLSYEQELRRELTTVEYELVTRSLSLPELIARAPLDEEKLTALVYPDGDARAGEFIPIDEWEQAQQQAWSVYVTTPGNGRAAVLEAEVLVLYRLYCPF